MSIGAVIVNFNTGPLALDAALSILGDDPAAKVVIVDNASTDQSIDFFEDFFSGAVDHTPSAPADAPAAVTFARPEDIRSVVIDDDGTPNDADLYVIRASKNGGFGAGSNIGLRFLERVVDPEIYLLLNPDAVIAKGSISKFRQRLQDSAAGLCGASVLRFENPQNAQAFGGATLNKLTLLGQNIGAGRSMKNAPQQALVEAKMSYPLGAAIAFRKDYLEHAGFFDERFFLYYEEADLARRGTPAMRPVWARSAIVYHRHGASAGSRQAAGGRSVGADFHMARSRMLYARKWRPTLTPVLIALSFIQAGRRVLRGRWRQACAVMQGALAR